MDTLIIGNAGGSAARIFRYLTSHGHRCCLASTGEQGLRLAALKAPDIILLNVGLSGPPAPEVIRPLRKSGNETPLIVLDASAKPQDRICGLNCGADDYLVKPFSPDELLARIHAVLRRSVWRTPVSISIRGLTVNVQAKTASYLHKEIALTRLEFKILEYLARNVGWTRSLEMIYREVWERELLPEAKVVEARLCNLRKKLCRVGAHGFIRTVRGFGYVLK